MVSTILKNGLLPALLLLSLIMMSCENEETGSIYDPNFQSPKPAAVITNITPTNGLGGVTVITINGSNFSSVPAENIVYFDTKQAVVQSASSTQLKVKAPDLVKDTIKIKIGVANSTLFSNTAIVKLEAAVIEFGQLAATDEAWGTTVDATGNFYVSLLSYGSGVGVKKITPEGKRSDYAPTGGVTKWSAIKFGPGGELYCARILRAIYKIPAGGGNPVAWVAFGSLGTVFDLDFDQNQNIWAGGNNTSVYRVKQDKSVAAYPLDMNVRSIRVFNGYVYCGGKLNSDGSERIIRFRIDPSTADLGTQEDIFNLTTSPNGGVGKTLYAISFATDGDMYVGTDASEPIIIVHADKSTEPLHPGLLKPAMHIFSSISKSNYLVAINGTASSGAVSTSGKIYKINILKTIAPYFGQ
ncbi:MAG: IPT/TIG domain-containing protein [bacterium]